MTASKEVAVPEKAGAVATFDYGEDAGLGFEGTKGSDLSVPFMSVLQSNSKQVEEKSPAGAESGMFYNTVTRELLDGDAGFPFIACHKEGPIWVEWVPLTKGGGFVALHDPESDVVKNGTPIMNDEGKETRKLRHGENELVETFYLYGLLLDEELTSSVGFAVISFTSTKIKPYRDFITATYTLRVPAPNGAKVNPPMLADRALFRTVKMSRNNKTFYNLQIEPAKTTWAESALKPSVDIERALMTEAKEFRDMVLSGMARASHETERSTGEDGPATTAEGDTPPF